MTRLCQQLPDIFFWHWLNSIPFFTWKVYCAVYWLILKSSISPPKFSSCFSVTQAHPNSQFQVRISVCPVPIQLEPCGEQTGQLSSVFEEYLLCHSPIVSTFPVTSSFLNYVILKDPWDKIFSFCLDRTFLIWRKENNQLNYLYIRSLSKHSLIGSYVLTHLKWEKLYGRHCWVAIPKPLSMLLSLSASPIEAGLRGCSMPLWGGAERDKSVFHRQ